MPWRAITPARHKFNEALRQYIHEHNKVLFDFGDLDVWYGNEYTPNIYDWDDYARKPLLEDIPLEHPNWHGDDWGHTSWASCENKAKAVWWMLARIAGWHGGLSAFGMEQFDDFYSKGDVPPWHVSRILFAHYTATGQALDDSLFSTDFVK